MTALKEGEGSRINMESMSGSISNLFQQEYILRAKSISWAIIGDTSTPNKQRQALFLLNCIFREICRQIRRFVIPALAANFLNAHTSYPYSSYYAFPLLPIAT